MTETCCRCDQELPDYCYIVRVEKRDDFFDDGVEVIVGYRCPYCGQVVTY